MNILIIGCGMVGAALATTLDGRGHDVSVIDKNAETLETLPASFGGFTTTGVPIDQDVLKRAGISTCDALFAVTHEDDIAAYARRHVVMRDGHVMRDDVADGGVPKTQDEVARLVKEALA